MFRGSNSLILNDTTDALPKLMITAEAVSKGWDLYFFLFFVKCHSGTDSCGKGLSPDSFGYGGVVKTAKSMGIFLYSLVIPCK